MNNSAEFIRDIELMQYNRKRSRVRVFIFVPYNSNQRRLTMYKRRCTSTSDFVRQTVVTFENSTASFTHLNFKRKKMHI